MGLALWYLREESGQFMETSWEASLFQHSLFIFPISYVLGPLLTSFSILLIVAMRPIVSGSKKVYYAESVQRNTTVKTKFCGIMLTEKLEVHLA